MDNRITRSFVALSCGAALACAPEETAGSTNSADTTDADTGTETGEPGETSNTSETEGPTETGETGETPSDLPIPVDPNQQIPPVDEEGCHGIYAQNLLPTFELTITDVVWEQLMYEWNNGEAIEEMGLNPKVYHPLAEFRYRDILIEDAEIRLRGNATYWDPLPEDKMQFQIGFHRNDEDGRFLGLSRVLFDAATANRHMLRDRLALAVMRDVGIKAPCANSARVVINGEYYGLFTNIEKLDEVFLNRVFDDPTGDLWKRANWQLKTNKDTANEDRLDALKDAESPEELYTYFDLEQALRVFAAQAVLPESDGPWAGGLNFYLYDNPLTGKFMLLPWDLDNGFERFNDEDPNDDYPINPDPIVWEKATTRGRPQYDLALTSPEWFAFYITQIDEIVHQGYTPEKLHAHIDTWTAQIQDAVVEDTNKPYSNDLYFKKVDELHGYVQQRYEFLEGWLECWDQGGVADSDGYCVAP